MKFISFLLLCSFLLYAQEAYNAADQIKKENLEKTVRILCADEYAGRLPGSAGYNEAATYAADQFEKSGLKKINGSYFQKFDVEYNRIFSPVKLNLVEGNKIIKEYTPGKDFVCRGFTGSGNQVSEIVFCGYGIEKDFYNDFKDADVKGKIIMIFKPNPAWNIGENKWESGYPRAKSNVAARNGAAGIIFVSLPNADDPQLPVASVLHGDGIQELNIPQVHVELRVADELLRRSGYTISQLQSIIDSTKKPFSFPLKTTVELLISADYDSTAETMNVWGMLEGSDPLSKNEYVIVGAHLDHVGKQGDVVFEGANDNASGSAAVLEIAGTFTRNKIKPARSIIFALFASEEQGLYGARYMAENLPVDIENVTAMLNLDCIAFGDSIQLGNGKSAPQLWNLAKNIDASLDNYSVDETWQGGGADAGPFHDKGIPALYYVSINSYKFIHTIYDTPESLNFELMEKITRLAFLTAYEIAEGNYSREVVK